MNIDLLITVFAGGLFGVILGKFLDSAPDWVFWLIVVAFFGAMLWLLSVPG